MSRVAKAPVSVPSNIEVTLNGNEVTVKGPKGSLTEKLNTLVSVKQDKGEGNQLLFAPATNAPTAWAQAGTARALVNNMVMGVTEGFSKTLELIGVGYRAQAKPKSITLSLGFSHPVEYKLPEGVTAESTSNTTLVLSSTDKRLLGQVAAEIRSFRPPEPYKGKGIRYLGEQISRKEAKKK